MKKKEKKPRANTPKQQIFELEDNSAVPNNGSTAWEMGEADAAADQSEPVTEPAQETPPEPAAAAVAEQRSSDRVGTSLKTIIQGHTQTGEKWKEITNVSTVSRNGAGFALSRQCTVGTLLALVLPMPAELRDYDHDKELYPTMGLVQYCHKNDTIGEPAYRVGVAFVGKEIPDSYRDDPLRSYRISGKTESGIWKITEAVSQFTIRAAPRFWIPIEAALTVMQHETRSVEREEVITRNVSSTGACVTSSLRVAVGQRVKFSCKELDFFSIAIVRNQTLRGEKPPMVHLEFVDARFPVEKIDEPEVIEEFHEQQTAGEPV